MGKRRVAVQQLEREGPGYVIWNPHTLRLKQHKRMWVVRASPWISLWVKVFWRKQKFRPHLAWMSIFEVLLFTMPWEHHRTSTLSQEGPDTLLPVFRWHRNGQTHVESTCCKSYVHSQCSRATHNHSHADCPAKRKKKKKEKKKKILLYWIHILTTKIADTNIKRLLSYDSLLRMNGSCNPMMLTNTGTY